MGSTIPQPLMIACYVIGLPYRWRWKIELFFRWLKVHTHFRHLTSHSKNGVTSGFYIAVIGVLLIYLHTQRPVSKYAYAMLSLVASGQATLEDIVPILQPATPRTRTRTRTRAADPQEGRKK